MYKLNDVEETRIKEINDAITLLFGYDMAVSQYYCFTKSNGIGHGVEYEVTLKNGLVIRKDVTDYGSW